MLARIYGETSVAGGEGSDNGRGRREGMKRRRIIIAA